MTRVKNSTIAIILLVVVGAGGFFAGMKYQRSKIIILTDATSINKSSAGSKVDLKTGEKVVVFGMENSDGSVTAQSVQLDPQLRGFLESTPSGSAR